MTLQRSAWLARPWFFVAVAVLALNDHVLKAAFPGWITGKLSDFAGLVVVGTLASVLLGPWWGTVLTGLGFVALKTLPGVAEILAPLMGGGVTARDATDLIALVVLPVLVLLLRRQQTTHAARARRDWVLVGLLASVVATTATSRVTPPPGLVSIQFNDGSFYAAVYQEGSTSSSWLRSLDGGASWRPAEDPAGDARVSEAHGVWSACAADGACFRVRHVEVSGGVSTATGRELRSGRDLIERRELGSDWKLEAAFEGYYSTVRELAINPGDSTQAMTRDVTKEFGVLYRDPSGGWQPHDLEPDLDRSGMVMIGVALTVLMGLIFLGNWLHRRRPGFDPPDGAR